jgi:hypothetical protein
MRGKITFAGKTRSQSVRLHCHFQCVCACLCTVCTNRLCVTLAFLARDTVDATIITCTASYVCINYAFLFTAMLAVTRGQ